MAARQGAKHHAAKMTTAKVRQARKYYDAGKYTVAALAKKYAVSWTAMNMIVRRESWKHVS
ncbi:MULTISPECIES: hypothetical protein [Streptomyces]|uniref:hypothetical protein n=1 Tax=Streptomyces TaxID=1883 RepID=UPI0016756AE2|nr:hypothetical protein [Streptomyces roseolus]GGR51283.1 hypothetical protein GCM10010282_50190 [Streptomyces roseolus]